MLALLSTALLVSVVLAVPATLLVFTVPVRRHRVALLTTPVAASTAGLATALASLGVGAVAGAPPDERADDSSDPLAAGVSAVG